MIRTLLRCLLMPLWSSAAEWEEMPSLPSPNGGALVGVAGAKIMVVGGTNWKDGAKNWLRTVYVFDPTRKAWTVAPELASPVGYGLGLQDGGRFGYIGGTDGQKACHSLVDILGETFVTRELHELPPSVLSAGGCMGGRAFIIGGTDEISNIAGLQRTTHSVDMRTGKVARLADYPGKPVGLAAAAVVGEELFVFGGMNCDEATKAPKNSMEAYAFFPKDDRWRKLPSLVAGNRGASAVALDERHVYLAGGYTDAFTADATIYDVKLDEYRKAPGLPYAAMVSLVTLDGFVYCIGGEDKMKSRTDRFYRIPVAVLLE